MRLLLALAAAGLVAGCAGVLVKPTEADVPVAERLFPGTTLAHLEKGREIYVARCSSCHGLRLPEDHTPEEWPKLLNAMAPRARLDYRQKELVLRFVMTMSERAWGSAATVEGSEHP